MKLLKKSTSGLKPSFLSPRASVLGSVILSILLSGLLLPLSRPVQAAPDPNPAVYLFWAKGCPHCLKEKQFLAELSRKFPEVRVVELEITENPENRELFRKVGERLHADVSGVPFTVVGEQYFIGWQGAASTGAALEAAVQRLREKPGPDVVGRLLTAAAIPPQPPGVKPLPEKLTVPLLGEVEIKYLSLGLLTLIIGLLDGFNPCAMWVLIFLINLLLGMEDRRKMWILGSTFILTSGTVYFLFMTAWLNLLIFVGFIVWIRLIIGGVALGAAFVNLKEFVTDKTGACVLTNGEKRQRKMARLQEIVHSRNFWLALGGLILLAFAVNLVELICSAGFPVIYLQVLSLTPLPFWQYYLYMVFYIFLYMLDDMIVFVAAMITLQLLGVGTRYKRFSNLIGGVLMLILGLLLIFKPELLMFG